ncbi:GntR family transcriptional regulator [Ramlibacter sp.]|uniref:GntR family transcriptional regulator n=1 Tax=Ramlibacter sp. TaxID=1917967 RepID=UPI003D0C900F
MSDLSPEEDAQARAYRFLKHKLSRCEYRPRERIYAHKIADEIEVSRTPVREALGRLVHEGLVQKEGGWGYSVRALSAQEIRDLYSVRMALEVEAARAALDRIGTAELARIDKLLALSAKHLEKSRTADFVETSRSIHRAIAEASGNRVLIDLLAGLHERIQVLGFMLNSRNRRRSPQVLQENTEMVAALHAKDLERLEQAIRTHLHNGCASTIEAVREYVTP